VSNNSWIYYGGTTNDVVYQAVDYARTHNHLVIAAAGNDGFNNDKSIWRSYPASFNLSNVISVAATDSRDAKPNWSNYGSTSVDLGAPGVNILSTLPGGGYGNGSGTSMATPNVTGTVGLILATRPDLAAFPGTIKSLILNTVDKLKALSGKVASGGRLNAFAALSAAQGVSLPSGGSSPSDFDGNEPGTGGRPGRASITGLDASDHETLFVTDATSGSDRSYSIAFDVEDESDDNRESNVQPVTTSEDDAIEAAIDEPLIAVDGMSELVAPITIGVEFADFGVAE
jgi:subtilisin family serine protease